MATTRWCADAVTLALLAVPLQPPLFPLWESRQETNVQRRLKEADGGIVPKGTDEEIWRDMFGSEDGDEVGRTGVKQRSGRRRPPRGRHREWGLRCRRDAMTERRTHRRGNEHGDARRETAGTTAAKVDRARGRSAARDKLGQKTASIREEEHRSGKRTTDGGKTATTIITTPTPRWAQKQRRRLRQQNVTTTTAQAK